MTNTNWHPSHKPESLPRAGARDVCSVCGVRDGLGSDEPCVGAGGEIRFIGDMQRLELKPGDIIVIKAAGHLDSETIDRIKEYAVQAFPLHQVVVFGPGFDIGVLSREPFPDDTGGSIPVENCVCKHDRGGHSGPRGECSARYYENDVFVCCTCQRFIPVENDHPV